ncbi:hypothetical protein BpHYR1_012576 [Brachionus plicatilis]|uniref:Uncharacterized protein n=1 Tax=Brachionus plicatilis TaxID=10195 RepID=A0A3M7QRZ1_BRAPC|nr:hypothetical protein BpHYR1_012576 [Brachionus plicatilis]
MTKDGWYEGLQLFTPSTNNSLKATNRAIKDEDTLSDRLVLSSFIVVALSIVKKWSIERNPSTVNAKVFQQNTTIKLSDWTNGYNWAKLNKQVIEKETDNEIMYYLPAKDKYIDMTMRNSIHLIHSKMFKLVYGAPYQNTEPHIPT